MKITFRLVGLVEQGKDVERFTLSSDDGKSPRAQEVAWKYFQENTTVQGLQFNLRGDGLILLKADNAQLNAKAVRAIRKTVEAALAEIR